MFDREFAQKQIKLFPVEELRNIYKNKDSGDYVPEYILLVLQELKGRGVEAEDTQVASPALPVKEEIKLAKNTEVASVIAEKIKQQLNLAELSTADLAQLFIWESHTPYVMAIIEADLRKRGQDPKEILALAHGGKNGPESSEKACGDCGVQAKSGDNFCCNCGAPLTESH